VRSGFIYASAAHCGEIESSIMDEHRFDTWIRALVHAGSRRRLVRAVVGGAALLTAGRRGLSNAAAHHGMAGPGDPCRTDNQCVAADAPMACDWNGYGNGTNCCTYEGNRCGFDAACCGTAICIGGYCSSGSPSSCTGVGCACMTGTFSPCDYGLQCCAIYPGLAGGAGVCQWSC
jgi:hypothetical protein